MSNMLTDIQDTREIEEIFNHFDKNNCGTLTKEQFREGIKEFAGPVYADHVDWDKLIEEIDHDHKGFVNFHDFKTVSNNFQVS